MPVNVDSIQQWCKTALVELSKAARRKPSLKSNHEQVIELAAWRSVLLSRKIAEKIEFIAPEMEFDHSDDCLSQLIETCPIDGTSSAEILGVIHEYLISQRYRSQKNEFNSLASSRKRSGIFYTPQPVIDYMLRQTLAKQLERRTPLDVDQLTILDPAAGCGAFLTSAFRTLINWHRDWYLANQPERWTAELVRSDKGWHLSQQKCLSILQNSLFGVDLDEQAIWVIRRILTLILLEESSDPDGDSSGPPLSTSRHSALVECLSANFKQGHSLTGNAFDNSIESSKKGRSQFFDWSVEFPQISSRGGFDIILGNPPYRRERDFKNELDSIGSTALGRFRSPRMDLWYYFVHRGLELLRPAGTLSFITNAYWISGTGADNLIAAMRDEAHLDQLFYLRDQPIFPGVMGKHSIFQLTKHRSDEPVMIKIAGAQPAESLELLFQTDSVTRQYAKPMATLFRHDRLSIWHEEGGFLERLGHLPQLKELGKIRQGIAENPATINRKTIERFRHDSTSLEWKAGEGVFSLTPQEVAGLNLTASEANLLRPYHDLCDLRRYWAASMPSRQLIYSTQQTCPNISEFPTLQNHLQRFRTIMESRRETTRGQNRWWHLHWPRDESIWKSNKLIVPQMATRPSFVPTFQPSYVSFSANVFVPFGTSSEDLRYLAGLLNSRLIWAWLHLHAKHRGIGLELNGHILASIPIRRIDFGNLDDRRRHDELVEQVDQRIRLEQQIAEKSPIDDSTVRARIEELEKAIDLSVESLYGLEETELEFVDDVLNECLTHSN